MSREIPKPYLIAKDEEGAFRLTVREVRYNSQTQKLQGDVDGDGEKDWQIRIANKANLAEDDFLF